MSIRLFPAASLLCLLSACGGGGGGSDVKMETVDWSVASATGGVDSSNNIVLPTTQGPGVAYTADLTYESGRLVAITVPGLGGFTVDSRQGDTINRNGDRIRFSKADSSASGTIDIGFSNVTITSWIESDTGARFFGSSATGADTPTSLPTGNAIFIGRSQGHAILGNRVHTANGTFELSTDFSTVSTSVYNVYISDVFNPVSQELAPYLGFGTRGVVTGTEFSAFPLAASTVTGEVEGEFYGAGADSVAGTFSVENKMTGDQHFGAFGASQ